MTHQLTPYYVLNRNEGMDTVHRNPREECNVDDADGRQTIDEATALKLSLSKDVARCQHCWADPAPTAQEDSPS